MFWPREDRLQGGQRNLVPDLSIALIDDQYTKPTSFTLLQPYISKEGLPSQSLGTQRNAVNDSTNQQDRKNLESESLDTSILRTLYTYYQKHPGDPEMSIDDLIREIPGHHVETVRTELFSLKKKGWIGYDLTASGTAGLVWIEPKGIKIAKQLS